MSRLRGPAGRIALLLLVTAAPSCVRTDAFAPQSGEAVVHVRGAPNDGRVRLTAFVEDTLAPNNRLETPLFVGQVATFSNLGEGFGVRAGIMGLERYRCEVTDAYRAGIVPGLAMGTQMILTARASSPDSAVFVVRCHSGIVRLRVTGLPDSALATIIVDSPDEVVPQVARVRVGMDTLLRVVPGSRVEVIPFAVAALPDAIYEAIAGTIAVTTDDTTTVVLDYAIRTSGAGFVSVGVSGIPNDTAITFPLALQFPTLGRSDSGAVRLGRTFRFTGVPAETTAELVVGGLEVPSCEVRSATFPFTLTAGQVTIPLRTSADSANFINLVLRCRSATASLVVSGLPSGDSSAVTLVALTDTQRVTVRNGTTLVRMLEDPTTHITPASLTRNDVTYIAEPQTVALVSRQSTTIPIQYAAANAGCNIDQPIAWYRLDSSANDASGNGQHGTLVGGSVLADRNGVEGAAMAFDGIDDRIDLGDRFNTLQLPVTIAAWVHQPAAARGEFRSIFASDDMNDIYAGFFLQTTPDGQLQVSYSDNGPASSTHRRTLQADAPLPTSSWTHVVATVRGPTDMTLYVNGAAVSGTYDGSGGPMVHTSAPARIASFSLIPANRPWLGRLDEVRLYSCSLSATEVSSLFQR